MTSDIALALLPDRGVVSVSGTDTAKLLQGLLTNDLSGLDAAPAIYAGLLSPQGKILFDFFVVKSAGGVLLDVARDRADDLVKRLTLYKLRADVTFRNVSEDHAVLAAFGPQARLDMGISYPDPRLPGLGWRAIVAKNDIPSTAAPDSAYHAHRIASGVPEGGRDFTFGDTFPHEALFDQLHGVSFTKGCYVGQEIVSRMEHRGTARKRVVPVVADVALQEGTAVKAGDIEIGTVGSVCGRRGLALLKLDRAGEAAAKGVTLMAGSVPISIQLPDWVRFTVSAAHS